MSRPNLSYLKSLFLALFGVPCGLLTGLTGMGNSVLAAPGLRWLLGLRPARLSATALAATFFAALASLLSYQQRGWVFWGTALLLAFGQLIGAAWGQRLAERVPTLTRLSWLWALLTMAVGAGMVIQGLHTPVRGSISFHPAPLPPNAFAALGVALAVGLVSRLAGLGGVLVVPAAIYLLGMTPHAAQGTALVVLLLAALPGALIHARRGDVEPQSAAWVSFGAVFGGLMGAYFAVRLSPGALLAVFGAILLALGVTLLWRNAPPPPEG